MIRSCLTSNGLTLNFGPPYGLPPSASSSLTSGSAMIRWSICSGGLGEKQRPLTPSVLENVLRGYPQANSRPPVEPTLRSRCFGQIGFSPPQSPAVRAMAARRKRCRRTWECPRINSNWNEDEAMRQSRRLVLTPQAPCLLLLAQRYKSAVPQVAILGPLHKLELTNERGLEPSARFHFLLGRVPRYPIS
jgi:hypothetical protein